MSTSLDPPCMANAPAASTEAKTVWSGTVKCNNLQFSVRASLLSIWSRILPVGGRPPSAQNNEAVPFPPPEDFQTIMRDTGLVGTQM